MKLRYSLQISSLAALVLVCIPSALSQTGNFSVSSIPEPAQLVQTLSQEPAYESDIAQCQALVATTNMLRLMSMNATYRATIQPNLKPEFDRLRDQYNAKYDSYQTYARSFRNRIDESAMREALTPTNAIQLDIIEWVLPVYAATYPDETQEFRAGAQSEADALAKEAERVAKRAERQMNAEEGNLSLYSIIAGVGLLGLLLLTKRSLADSGFGYAVSSVVGEVMREQKRSSTSISVSSNPSSYNQRGSTNVNVNTTEKQEIFLKLSNGKEWRLDFTNFNVPCRETHKLSVLYANRNGFQPLVAGYHNHNTDESIWFERAVNIQMRPRISRMLSLMWWGLFAFGAALYFMVQGNFNDGFDTVDGVLIAASASIEYLIFRAIYSSRSFGQARKRWPEIQKALRGEVAQNEANITL